MFPVTVKFPEESIFALLVPLCLKYNTPPDSTAVHAPQSTVVISMVAGNRAVAKVPDARCEAFNEVIALPLSAG